MLIQPAGFPSGKKYPAVVYVAGGPGQQAVHDAWDGDISMWQQLLAQHGYVVFAVDNRGTAGRGHLFEEPIHYKLSGQEIPDQVDGLQFLRSLPYVDTARIGIWGRGFGGMLTVNAMLHPRLLPSKRGLPSRRLSTGSTTTRRLRSDISAAPLAIRMATCLPRRSTARTLSKTPSWLRKERPTCKYIPIRPWNCSMNSSKHESTRKLASIRGRGTLSMGRMLV